MYVTINEKLPASYRLSGSGLEHTANSVLSTGKSNLNKTGVKLYVPANRFIDCFPGKLKVEYFMRLDY